MNLPQGSSRPPSTPDDPKDGSRKANTDSGFHDDDHSSSPRASSSSGGGGKRNYRHHRRKAQNHNHHHQQNNNGESEPDDQTDGEDHQQGTNNKERHDSLASMFSDIQDYSNYLDNSSDASSLSSSITGSASSGPSMRRVGRAAQNPKVSSAGGGGSGTKNGHDSGGGRAKTSGPAFKGSAPATADARKSEPDQDDYEFPSDTELSEIIAIMSGIATPRKSLKGKQESQMSLDDSSSTPLTIKSDHYASSQGLSIDDDDGDGGCGGGGVGGSMTPTGSNRYHLQQQQQQQQQNSQVTPTQVRTEKEGGRLYERNVNGYRPGHNSNGTPAMTNGRLANGNSNNNNSNNGILGRRYLPKQGLSLDSTGSFADFHNSSKSDFNKETSLNSLEDILRATKSGKFLDTPKKNGNNNNKDNKKKKENSSHNSNNNKRPNSGRLKDSEYTDQRSWKQRLKVCGTLFVSVALILISSSLLFIVPIIVDPILVGLEAQFSTVPAQCRTIRKRNGTGAVDCAVPSCREGCTADLLFCYFIDVEYRIGVFNTSTAKSSPFSLSLSTGSNYLTENHSTSLMSGGSGGGGGGDILTNSTSLLDGRSNGGGMDPHFHTQAQEGILLVNVNGCGYPPQINCTEFERKFGELNTTFPCFFSAQNESIVVPFYSQDQELVLLSIWLVIPCCLCLLLSGLLYLLIRWRPKPKRKKIKKNNKLKVDEVEAAPLQDKKLMKRKEEEQEAANGVHVRIKSGQQLHGPDDGTLRLSLNPKLAAAPGMPLGNGTLGNIMSDLAGITSNNFIKKRHYTKFHTTSLSISIPTSPTLSRENSIMSPVGLLPPPTTTTTSKDSKSSANKDKTTPLVSIPTVEETVVRGSSNNVNNNNNINNGGGLLGTSNTGVNYGPAVSLHLGMMADLAGAYDSDTPGQNNHTPPHMNGHAVHYEKNGGDDSKY